MSERFTRVAQQLDAAFTHFGIRDATTPTEDGVSISWDAVNRLRGEISSIQGGSGVPFIVALLRTPPRTDVTLRGDEPHHLRRALDDLWRKKTRNEQIDRGLIPGALSGSEVMRLMRRHPQMFTGRPRKETQ